MRATVSIVLLLSCLFAGGCVRVTAAQREKLASSSMTVGLGEQGLAGPYHSKFVESKTAGGLPGTAPGGGCGCAQ
jgi:hypothetical protein